jgi:hypothetical protein
METVELVLSNGATVLSTQRGDKTVLIITDVNLRNNIRESLSEKIDTTRGRSSLRMGWESPVRGRSPPRIRQESPVRGKSPPRIIEGRSKFPYLRTSPSPAGSAHGSSGTRTAAEIWASSEHGLVNIFDQIVEDIGNFGLRVIGSNLISRREGYIEVSDAEAAQAFALATPGRRFYTDDRGRRINVDLEVVINRVPIGIRNPVVL